MEDMSLKAVNASLSGMSSFCKFLTANDTGKTGGHQSGYLISKSASEMIFPSQMLLKSQILKKYIRIQWQDDFITNSCFTWYGSKNELRITRFGKDFPFYHPVFTGALFVLVKLNEEEYKAYILNTDDDINQFLDTFGLTPAETNRPIDFTKTDQELREKAEIDNFIKTLCTDFPTSEEMSAEARRIIKITLVKPRMVADKPFDPDKMLLDWTEEEYVLFQAIERYRYGSVIKKGFKSVDEFVVLANQVLNRRKSRAGKSLEHHLAAIFDQNRIRYTAQGVTEGNKKPDFVFPSIEDYHNILFSVDKLCTLAAKTTCKDRWRQVLNEADRMRDRNKYLCTLQRGISEEQMDEMKAEKVILVVPASYIRDYPVSKRSDIWTISDFIHYVKKMEMI